MAQSELPTCYMKISVTEGVHILSGCIQWVIPLEINTPYEKGDRDEMFAPFVGIPHFHLFIPVQRYRRLMIVSPFLNLFLLFDWTSVLCLGESDVSVFPITEYLAFLLPLT